MTTAPTALIRLAGIERVFLLGDSEVHALHELDLRIDPGEYVAVMGPSGSGKSTLLNLIGLLDRRPQARITWKGATSTLSSVEHAHVRSTRIGFVFQSFHLVPRLTAAENVTLPMMLAGIPAAERSKRVARHGRLRAEGSRRSPPRAALRRTASAGGDRPRHRPAARR